MMHNNYIYVKGKITKILFANEENIKGKIKDKNDLTLIGWDVLSCQLKQKYQKRTQQDSSIKKLLSNLGSPRQRD